MSGVQRLGISIVFAVFVLVVFNIASSSPDEEVGNGGYGQIDQREVNRVKDELAVAKAALRSARRSPVAAGGGGADGDRAKHAARLKETIARSSAPRCGGAGGCPPK